MKSLRIVLHADELLGERHLQYPAEKTGGARAAEPHVSSLVERDRLSEVNLLVKGESGSRPRMPSEISKVDCEKGLASTALPGRKLATSKTPRMLTPSEVDLLRQDLKAALSHPMPRVRR